jgi:hypothetical protein
MKNHIEKILISDQEPAAPAKNGDKGKSEDGEEKETGRGIARTRHYLFRRASTEREKGNRI